MQNKIEQAQNKLRKFWHAHRRLPSFSEMAELFDYASKNSVSKLVAKLKQAGIVDQDDNGQLIPGELLTGLPLMGNVQAGFPSPAEEELVDTLTLDKFLINRPESSFVIEVSGNSMLDAGIQPGDLVIVDRSLEPKNNDIVLANIDNEWTLKYFFKKGSRIYLQAANNEYPDLIPKEELTIGGVIVSSIRKYKS